MSHKIKISARTTPGYRPQAEERQEPCVVKAMSEAVPGHVLCCAIDPEGRLPGSQAHRGWKGPVPGLGGRRWYGSVGSVARSPALSSSKITLKARHKSWAFSPL